MTWSNVIYSFSNKMLIKFGESHGACNTFYTECNVTYEYTLYILYTLYTVYTLYILYTVYTVYNVYNVYTVYTVYNVYNV